MQKHNEHRGRNRSTPHLLDHDYFRPVVYENIPIEELMDEDEEKDPEENVPITYRQIPGIHHGSRVYVDNLGFKYYKREARVNRIYLVCERQKSRLYEYCPCTASVSSELVDIE